MRLIFNTPSRNCPLRHLNGQEVIVRRVVHGRFVSRMGSYGQAYVIQPADNDLAPLYGYALADELHIAPNVDPIFECGPACPQCCSIRTTVYPMDEEGNATLYCDDCKTERWFPDAA